MFLGGFLVGVKPYIQASHLKYVSFFEAKNY